MVKKQRRKINPMDTSATTVALKLVMLMAAINNAEGRDVAIMDIPEAFISASFLKDEIVNIVFQLRMAEFIVNTDPRICGQYIFKGTNRSLMLYVQLKKVLYILLRSAFLFYEKLVGDLKANGFKLNPYDCCVINKIVNGKQLTIFWHVDDLKVFYVDMNVVTNTITWIESVYREMHGSRGKKHDYLGMW